MADLEIRNLHVSVEDKEILKGLDLDVSKGEIHALMGPNGSGKSTLANAIMGHPGLEITEGTIRFNGEDITEAAPDERSRAGLFMAFQYPVAIPGVTVAKYLRMVLNAHREARGETEIKLKDFRKETEAAMELVNIPRVLQPLPERRLLRRREEAHGAAPAGDAAAGDRGPRRDRLRPRHRRAAHRRRRRQPLRRPRHGVLIITHYQRILHLIEPDLVHVMSAGRIVKEGGPELVAELEEKGYGWIRGRGEVEAKRRGNGDRRDKGAAPARRSSDLEKVREAFPALAREVNGKPIAYLDIGRVVAARAGLDPGGRPLRALHHSNVHRGSHTMSAEATAAYEGARGDVADHLGAADLREVIFVRNATEAINLVARAWGDANVGAGDRIVLTEMEHHSNIVPWQQLAERSGAEIDWVAGARRRAAGHGGLDAALERGPKLVAVTHVSNVLGTRNPLAEISRLAHEAGALVLVDGAQARRSCRSTSPSWASTSTRSPATRPTARPESAPSGRGSTCCARCRRSSAAGR